MKKPGKEPTMELGRNLWQKLKILTEKELEKEQEGTKEETYHKETGQETLARNLWKKTESGIRQL